MKRWYRAGVGISVEIWWHLVRAGAGEEPTRSCCLSLRPGSAAHGVAQSPVVPRVSAGEAGVRQYLSPGVVVGTAPLPVKLWEQRLCSINTPLVPAALGRRELSLISQLRGGSQSADRSRLGQAGSHDFRSKVARRLPTEGDRRAVSVPDASPTRTGRLCLLRSFSP